MAENVQVGWIKDKDNKKIAPKTLSSQVIYDNELSKLNSSTAQGAIDELANKVQNVSSEASNITFDKIDTDMVSTNIQDAIIEIWRELQLRALRSFEVVYMVDAGEGYKEEVQLGSTALLPESFTPTKDGYVFLGWRKDNQASNEIITECTVGEEPITLYAVFRKEHTVNFISNEYTESKTVYEYYNNANVLKGSTIAPVGKEMNGWSWRGWSNADSTAGNAAVMYNNNDIVNNINSNLNIYGLYQQNITLSYEGNYATGGSVASQTGIRYYNMAGNYINPSFKLSANGFTRTNCTFQKWAQDSASGTQYTAGTTITLSKNTTFYAKWQLKLSGSAYYNVSANHGAGETYTYSFSETFKSPPTIDYSRSSIDGDITTSIYNITTKSFTANFAHTKSSGQGCSFVWDAIGEPAKG